MLVGICYLDSYKKHDPVFKVPRKNFELNFVPPAKKFKNHWYGIGMFCSGLSDTHTAHTPLRSFLQEKQVPQEEEQVSRHYLLTG